MLYPYQYYYQRRILKQQQQALSTITTTTTKTTTKILLSNSMKPYCYDVASVTAFVYASTGTGSGYCSNYCYRQQHNQQRYINSHNNNYNILHSVQAVTNEPRNIPSRSLLLSLSKFGWLFHSKFKSTSTSTLTTLRTNTDTTTLYSNSSTATTTATTTSSSTWNEEDQQQQQEEEQDDTRNSKQTGIKNRKNIITFVTDIEGDKDYMIRYATISKVVCFRPLNDNDHIELNKLHNQQDISNTANTNNTNNESFMLHFPYKICLDFRQQHEQQQQQQENCYDQHNNSTNDCIKDTTTTTTTTTANNNNNHIFIFGGDAWDHGGNDLWVIRQLLFFKYRYPNNVFLLIGNRDCNKMRLIHELGLSSASSLSSTSTTTSTQQSTLVSSSVSSSSSVSNNILPYHKGVYWLRGTGYMGDPLQGPFLSNQTSVERLQWMLKYTMGSPKAFLYRKLELIQEQEQKQKQLLLRLHQQQQQQDGHNDNKIEHLDHDHDETTKTRVIVSDYDVVESYRHSCHPITGEMGQYLSYGQLLLRLGPIIFMHGGLPISPPIIKAHWNSNNNNNNNNNNDDNNKGTIATLDDFWNDLSFATPWLDRSTTTTTNTSTKDLHHNTTTVPLSFDNWVGQLNSFATDCVTNWKNEYSSMNSTTTTTTTTTTTLATKHEQDQPKYRQHDMWSWTGGYHHRRQQQQQQQQQASSDDPAIEMTSSSYVPKFTQLIQYGMGSLPNRIPNPTVVYNGCWKHFLPKEHVQGNPGNDQSEQQEQQQQQQQQQQQLFDTIHDDDDLMVQQTVQSFMKHTGVRLICCGHQPQGDMPNAIRVPIHHTIADNNNNNNNNANSRNNNNDSSSSNNEVGWIVSADTSYSGDTVWVNRESTDNEQLIRHNIGRGSIKSGRGPVAASEVYIEQCIDTGQILDLYFHGTLSDGSRYKTKSFQFIEPINDTIHNIKNDNDTDGCSSTVTGNNYPSALKSTTIKKENTKVTTTSTLTKVRHGLVGTVAYGRDVPDPCNSPHGGFWWNRAKFEFLYPPRQPPAPILSSSSSSILLETLSEVQELKDHNKCMINNNADNRNTFPGDKESDTIIKTEEPEDDNESPSLTMIVARKGFKVWNQIIQQ